MLRHAADISNRETATAFERRHDMRYDPDMLASSRLYGAYTAIIYKIYQSQPHARHFKDIRAHYLSGHI